MLTLKDIMSDEDRKSLIRQSLETYADVPEDGNMLRAISVASALQIALSDFIAAKDADDVDTQALTDIVAQMLISLDYVCYIASITDKDLGTALRTLVDVNLQEIKE